MLVSFAILLIISRSSLGSSTRLETLRPLIPGLPGTRGLCSPAIMAASKVELTAISATRPFAVSKYLGAEASARFLPTPAWTRPLLFTASKVFSRPP